MDKETEFLSGLIGLQYGEDVTGRLKELAKMVDWAEGWPEDNAAFWNAEAFMWGNKISKGKRELIARELDFLSSGKNLDLGCGAFSYTNSVGLDFSKKMLQMNENLVEKICGDLEKELPFVSARFDSVTAVFVLNYIGDYKGLLKEAHRVLKNSGILVGVVYSKEVNEWQRQKEVSVLAADEWVTELVEAGFSVDFYWKEGLWFFKCKKRDSKASLTNF